MRPSTTQKHDFTSGKPVTRHWSKPNPGLILLDSSLNPVAFNLEAASILSYPEGVTLEDSFRLKLPDEILNDLRRAHSALPVVTHFAVGRRNYMSQIFAMRAYQKNSSQAAFAVLLQRNCSTLEAIYEVAAEFRLTEREREALKGISLGLTSKELAKEMDISPNTVKAYLRLIMVKMGVSTRSGILAKILDHNQHADPQTLPAAIGSRAVPMRTAR